MQPTGAETLLDQAFFATNINTTASRCDNLMRHSHRTDLAALSLESMGSFKIRPAPEPSPLHRSSIDDTSDGSSRQQKQKHSNKVSSLLHASTYAQISFEKVDAVHKCNSSATEQSQRSNQAISVLPIVRGNKTRSTIPEVINATRAVTEAVKTSHFRLNLGSFRLDE